MFTLEIYFLCRKKATRKGREWKSMKSSVIFVSTIFLFIQVHCRAHIFLNVNGGRLDRWDRYLDGWNSKCFSFRVPLARETVKSQARREDVLLMIRFELFASSRKVPLRLFQSVHQRSYTKFLWIFKNRSRKGEPRISFHKMHVCSL